MPRPRSITFYVPLGISVAVVLLLAGFRLFSGAGFGLPTEPGPDGWVESGLFFNPHDNAQYLSWARQARDGQILGENLYTTESSSRIIFHPVLALTGWMEALSGIPALTWLILGGIFASALTVWLTSRLAIASGLDPTGIFFSTLLAAFGMGLGLISQFLSAALFHRTLDLPSAETAFADALFFTTSFAYPLIAIAYALMAGTIWLLFRGMNDCSSPALLVGLLLLTLALGLTHPFEGVMLAVLAVLVLFHDRIQRNTADPMIHHTRLWFLLGGVGLVVCYQLWICCQPVWRDAVQASMDLPQPRWTWLLGYGAALPLAMIGALQSFREMRLRRSRFYAFWFGIVFLALIVINTNRSKISAGAYLAIAILAGQGFSTLAGWVRRSTKSENRRLGQLGLGILVCLCFSGTFLYLDNLRFPHNRVRYECDLLSVCKRLTSSKGHRPRVLADQSAAMILPALTGAKVYAGNVFLTPGFWQKQRELNRLGFEYWDYPESLPRKPDSDGALPGAQALYLLRYLQQRENIEFLLTTRESPAGRSLIHLPEVRLQSTSGRWLLFEVLRQPEGKRSP